MFIKELNYKFFKELDTYQSFITFDVDTLDNMLYVLHRENKLVDDLNDVTIRDSYFSIITGSYYKIWELLKLDFITIQSLKLQREYDELLTVTDDMSVNNSSVNDISDIDSRNAFNNNVNLGMTDTDANKRSDTLTAVSKTKDLKTYNTNKKGVGDYSDIDVLGRLKRNSYIENVIIKDVVGLISLNIF